MNTKVVYGIGSILFLIGFILYLMNSSSFNSNSYLSTTDNSYKKTGLISTTLYQFIPKSQIANAFLPSIQQAYASSKQTPSNYENLTVAVKSVTIVPSSIAPSLQIAFDVQIIQIKVLQYWKRWPIMFSLKMYELYLQISEVLLKALLIHSVQFFQS